LDPLFHHDIKKGGVPVDKAVRNIRNKKINLFEHPVVLSTFVQGYHWRAVAIVNHRFHLLSSNKDPNKKCSFILMDSLYKPGRKSKRTRCNIIKGQIAYLSELLHKHAKCLELGLKIPLMKFCSDVESIHAVGKMLI